MALFLGSSVSVCSHVSAAAHLIRELFSFRLSLSLRRSFTVRERERETEREIILYFENNFKIAHLLSIYSCLLFPISSAMKDFKKYMYMYSNYDLYIGVF